MIAVGVAGTVTTTFREVLLSNQAARADAIRNIFLLRSISQVDTWDTQHSRCRAVVGVVPRAEDQRHIQTHLQRAELECGCRFALEGTVNQAPKKSLLGHHRCITDALPSSFPFLPDPRPSFRDHQITNQGVTSDLVVPAPTLFPPSSRSQPFPAPTFLPLASNLLAADTAPSTQDRRTYWYRSAGSTRSWLALARASSSYASATRMMDVMAWLGWRGLDNRWTEAVVRFLFSAARLVPRDAFSPDFTAIVSQGFLDTHHSTRRRRPQPDQPRPRAFNNEINDGPRRTYVPAYYHCAPLRTNAAPPPTRSTTQATRVREDLRDGSSASDVILLRRLRTNSPLRTSPRAPWHTVRELRVGAAETLFAEHLRPATPFTDRG
ncbi:hypothetical protein DFH06DRAFT_1291871 [Mycena polygramma]|nr:hypothetical protein DFH06DRAFT_1291871 [Mycena polygramma]